jgi:hypothetical protein
MPSLSEHLSHVERRQYDEDCKPPFLTHEEAIFYSDVPYLQGYAHELVNQTQISAIGRDWLIVEDGTEILDSEQREEDQWDVPE